MVPPNSLTSLLRQHGHHLSFGISISWISHIYGELHWHEGHFSHFNIEVVNVSCNLQLARPKRNVHTRVYQREMILTKSILLCHCRTRKAGKSFGVNSHLGYGKWKETLNSLWTTTWGYRKWKETHSLLNHKRCSHHLALNRTAGVKEMRRGELISDELWKRSWACCLAGNSKNWSYMENMWISKSCPLGLNLWVLYLDGACRNAKRLRFENSEW